jgi:inosine-uridine nucleoside N-ribohydrolase
MRVLIDNDFAGDPDGLFQLAHHLMSPSTDVRAIIGSHMHPGEGWGGAGSQAQAAARMAREVAELLGLAGRHPILAGAESALTSRADAKATAASDAIIAEAMREDVQTPLYYCAGAGLTDLATAWLCEPRIGPRLTLVWIGGPEYADLAERAPDTGPSEYNLTIDVAAAQMIFGESDIPIWQVPRDAYRQVLMSHAELADRVGTQGALGAHLMAQVERIMAIVRSGRVAGIADLGETFILGDSPLVTLTALQSSFHPDPSSSAYVLRPAPRIDAQGEYVQRADGRQLRVYTRIDGRLTFEDFCAKLRRWTAEPRG